MFRKSVLPLPKFYNHEGSNIAQGLCPTLPQSNLQQTVVYPNPIKLGWIFFDLVIESSSFSRITLISNGSVSKLEQGLRGWTQIEFFLKVAMMASESLSSRVAFEESDLPHHDTDETDSNSNYHIVETFVTFQKDNKGKVQI